MTGEGDTNPDVDTEECLKPHNFKQTTLKSSTSAPGPFGAKNELSNLFPSERNIRLGSTRTTSSEESEARTVKKFRDMGESDDDLQDVKGLISDPRHNIILVIRLESSHAYRKRYLMMISSPSNFKKKTRTTPQGHGKYSPSAISTPETNKSQDNNIREEIDLKNKPRAKSERQIIKPGSVPISFSSGSVSAEDLDFCLLGIDAVHEREDNGEIGELKSVTIGFVLSMLWGTRVSLDGDGGFSVLHLDKHFVFKPVSVQALWTVIQTLHLITGKLKPKRHSVCLGDSDWTSVYMSRIASPQSCINEWNTMPDVTVRRAPSTDELTRLSADQLDQETKKCLIKSKLREIMKQVDLDSITSKTIRNSLEQELAQNLNQYKAFIDEEILVILGQMDPASRIFDFLYLGSEWNASNLEELNSNGVTHILNTTKEIDNFFPSIFKYLNIREYDVEETDLMKYWDQTHNFIKECLGSGGKVLVHCKMGISRSASTVIAFAMKYFQWSMVDALEHVKASRSIIDPNTGFRHQLSVYEGILEASKKSATFRKQRSKSESSADRDASGRPTDNQGADTSSGKTRNTPSRALSCRVKRDKSTTLDPIFSPIFFGNQTKPPFSSSSSKQAHKPADYSFGAKQSGDSALGSADSLHSIGNEGDIVNNKIKELNLNCDNKTTVILPDWSKQSSGGSPNFDDKSYSSRSESEEPVVCHCYSDLAMYISSKHVRSSAIEEPRAHGHSTNNLVEATNLQVRLNPECPARTHIGQCTCNLELELKVPEAPVEVSVSPPSQETDLILRNLGNFPIDIRQRGSHKDDWLETIEFGNKNFDCHSENQKNDVLRLSGTEELSVKTLADMYEFKLGENPSKPPLPSKHTRIIESKIGEIAKKLSMSEVSEC